MKNLVEMLIMLCLFQIRQNKYEEIFLFLLNDIVIRFVHVQFIYKFAPKQRSIENFSIK